jgi:serine/threonine-protein kinase
MESSSPSPVQVGDLVAGKYRVERELGKGGMGVVVAAMHEQLEQRVALKFLLPEVTARPEIVQRFIREARASVRIHSEHVARVLDVGTHDNGVPFMVMEYLQGEDLSQVLLRTGPLPVQDAVGYVLEACEAVAEAHSLGMVHRDLKPANLFLARRPSGKPAVKVLDFGISKIPSTGADHVVTKTATVMGSPGYMSPEQMMSSDKVDVRSDIWSLGVVLYELLGQRLPFPGSTMPELIAAILQKAPEPLSIVRSDIPVGLAAVLDRCLTKEPAGRYANIAELARALGPFGPPRAEQSVERIETVLGVGNVRALSSDPPPPFPRGAQASSATFVPTTSQATSSSSRVVIPIVIGAVLVVAAVAFVGPKIRRATSLAPVSPSGSALATTTDAPSASSASTAAAIPDAGPVALADVPTASAAPTALPAFPGKSHPAVTPSHSSSPPAPPASTPPAPAGSCHIVSYFDANGDKHFKQECP